MISQAKQKGFTIVELLIVIVVIGILAAISLVAYANITARGKSATAQATAKAVKDTAEVYKGANGSYPATKSDFTGGGTDPIAKLPADIVFSTSAPTSSSSEKTVQVTPYGDTGFKVVYYDYAAKATKTVDVGNPTGTAGGALGNS